MTGAQKFVDETKIETVEELFTGSQLGRAFLESLGKSQKDEDLARIFTSLQKLESHTAAVRDEARMEAMRDELKSMSEAILQTRSEIAAIKPDQDSTSRIMAATEELDAITTATERATSDILSAAERIQAAAQGMREGGIDERICNMLDEQATNIFMACSFQDITGQRVQKVINLLRYLEQRINTMVGLWVSENDKDKDKSLDELQFNPMDKSPDAHLLSGPSKEGTGVCQDEVDRMLEENIPAAEPAPEPAPEPVAETAPEAAPEPKAEPAVEPAPAPQPDPAPAPQVAKAPEPAPEKPAPTKAETPAPVDNTVIPDKETVGQDDIDAMFG